MFSKFFIDRPVFATVLSVVIVIIGGIALLKLPVAQYPEVTPPTINVYATYPGASAATVADTVATPIELQVNGVENMIYMASRCTNDGVMSLDVTFKVGTNLDMAQVLVQNRVSIAQAQLPEEVRRQGVTTKKKSPNILQVVNLVAEEEKDPDFPGEVRYRFDQLYLSNYATIYVADELKRIPGVGDVSFLGPRDYSMRLWLDPEKLSSRGLLASDIYNAVRAQNVQVAAGRLGQEPAPKNVAFELTLITQGRLEKVEQFEQIVVKKGDKGQVVYLRDVVRDTVARITLDRNKLAELKITAQQVREALRKREIQIKPWTGRPDLPQDLQALRFDIVTPLRQVGKAVLTIAGKSYPLDELVRPQDGIQEREKGIELGAKNYDVSSYLDGKPAISLAIFQQPGSNAIATADSVRAKMDELKANFEKGMDYRIYYDTTVFVKESMHEVYKTLFEAFVLVFIVVLVFLQDWRACIMPMIEVPVSLIGTFGVMAMLGFSLNNLSMFGLVLAIGIVVDDAIVVVENVERWMAKGLDARTATIKAMEETTGAILAISLVLCAVFVPTAFLAGISGQFYRQFALTIAASTMISALNAMTMTPSRCAIILKHDPSKGHEQKEALPPTGIALLVGFLFYWLGSKPLMHLLGIEAHHDHTPSSVWAVRLGLFGVGVTLGWLVREPIRKGLGWFLGKFNKGFDALASGYGRVVRSMLRILIIMLVVYGGLIALTVLGFMKTPTGFIPEQDKGYLVAFTQLPDGAALNRTEEVVRRMAEMARQDPGVEAAEAPSEKTGHTIEVPGYAILTGSNIPSAGGIFIILKPFEERKGNEDLSAKAVAARLRQKFATIKEANCNVFGAPPVDGLGTTGGFKMQVKDLSGQGLRSLEGNVQNIVRAGNSRREELAGLFTSFTTNQPQLYLDIDRVKAEKMGVKVTDVFNTLQMYLGGAYVNDITLFNRNWQVNIQAGEDYRLRADDVGKLKVRNGEGKMVPLSTLITDIRTSGPAIVNHYNTKPSAEVNGNPAAGVSSGQAISIMEGIARDELAPGIGYEWTELTYQQLEAEKDVLNKLIFPLSVLFVFLVLAALYESWYLPVAILLIVPMCLLAALVGVIMARLDVNIFTQIGLVVLVGLASKNAILIVEFAKQRESEGVPRGDAAVEASELRLRPILMTSFAFALGVLPLVLASGAGAEMRFALGVAVFSGMLGVTAFGLFFTPIFYVLIRWIENKMGADKKPHAPMEMVTKESPPPGGAHS